MTVETVKERSATMLITPQAQALLHSAMQLTQESEETVLEKALERYVATLEDWEDYESAKNAQKRLKKGTTFTSVADLMKKAKLNERDI